jgi:hypothetical protein
METTLRTQLTIRFTHGKNKVDLNQPTDVINFGKETIEKYTNSPISKKTSTCLKFVQTHRDNYIELAGVILELKGWLNSHPEPSIIKDIARKRLIELIAFYGQLLQTLVIIGEGMATIENLIEDDAMALHNAKTIAGDILSSVGEVALFISQDIEQ